MSVTVADQRAFVSTFLQLVSLADDQDQSFFNNVSEYHRLQNLGPTLPTLSTPLPSGEVVETDTRVSLSFKSIKPPYKFSAELHDVSSNETIYKLKEHLIASVDTLKSNNIAPENLRFLVKGKVIQDTSALSSLPNYEAGLSFMCMVSQPTASSTASPPAAHTPTPSADPDVSIEDVSTVSGGAWNKIHGILVQDLKSEARAEEFLAKMKNSL